MRNLEGGLDGTGLKIAIVCSRFNSIVTQSLLDGALGALRSHGVDDDDIDVAWVPGALEIPLVAKAFADAGSHNAIITLGAVIRGETGHYDVVVNGCASSIQEIQLASGVPIAFGVLTTNTLQQALERAGAKEVNRGVDSAEAAIEMA
ncbi:MAG TPA: 6,7-dimethyl-8-ribityllumazine synthase, partial [Acidimicrobiales bacterium]|nr:6,7-dimethyl-8-ribityllumazine synthase [Acidimicrobiales bacterium]